MAHFEPITSRFSPCRLPIFITSQSPYSPSIFRFPLATQPRLLQTLDCTSGRAFTHNSSTFSKSPNLVNMPGGKGKSTGGKAGPKEAAGKTQKSHSAKAGLQVRSRCSDFGNGVQCARQLPPSRVAVAPTSAERSASECARRTGIIIRKAFKSVPPAIQCLTRHIHD